MVKTTQIANSRILRSDFSSKEFPLIDKILGKTIRKIILVVMQKDFPNFSKEKSLSVTELTFYREKYISNYFSYEIGELANLESKINDELKEYDSCGN